MRESRRLTVLVLLVTAVAGAFAGNSVHRAAQARAGADARYRIDAATAHRDHVPVLPTRVRDATFRFAAGTPAGDRAAFLTAVAAARPPARRLIDLVDGLVDVTIGPTGEPGAVGITESGGPRYEVTVDLGRVARLYGARGIDRVVLHELGHVVDHAIVPDDVMAGLQAGIPAGYGCDQGIAGACASPPERFAESFAKWATGDIGLDLFIGYKVLPPTPTLDAWGAPLAALGR
jgi:hypothetical protein